MADSLLHSCLHAVKGFVCLGPGIFCMALDLKLALDWQALKEKQALHAIVLLL